MTTTDSTTTPARAPGTVPALVGQGYRVNSDEWWTFDTEKYDFFHEQCCDCGLNHKTHVRLEADDKRKANAPAEARCKASPPAGCSAGGPA